MILGSQDTGALLREFKKEDHKKVLSELSSCKTLVLMKQEDPSEESVFLQGLYFGAQKPSLMELKDQKAGEAYIATGGYCGKITMHYAAAKIPDKIKLATVKEKVAPNKHWEGS